MAEGSSSDGGRPNTFNGPGGSTRRMSYASVASGVTPQSFIHPTRAGAFAHMATTTPSMSIPPIDSPDSRFQRRLSEQEQDMQSQGVGHYSRKLPPLPSYSRKYAGLPGYGYQPESDVFFTPTYLQNSRYTSKLRTAHTAKARSQGEPAARYASPTVATTPNTHRIAPSHRGMTYDVIESNPPKDEEQLIPLPTRWNNQDKYPGLDVLGDGLELKYSGSAGKSDVEAASVRTDYPMSPACGIYYYEIEIKQKSKDCAVAMGFSTAKASLERLPGWEPDSWAYHGDDGKIYLGEHQGKHYGETFGAGDVVGCGINFNTGQAFFTKNAQDLGVAFKELKHFRPFPCIGMKKYSGALISVNFGQRPFVFDIDKRMAEERAAVKSQIAKTKTSSLHSSKDESSLIQELIAQFLSHDGYIETAKAFGEEVRDQRQGLSSEQFPVPNLPEMDTVDAVQRQTIRRSILSGHIDQALELTNAHFAQALRESPEIVFKLKCRKWVELIERASNLGRKNDKLPRSNGLGKSHAANDDVFGQDMEVDNDHQSNGAGKAAISQASNTMETDNDMMYSQLMAQAMDYGQLLAREYRDVDTEYNKTLKDIFSLMAYEEPRESVHGHLMDLSGRSDVAEELNGAILASLGRPPYAVLENTYKQTEALIDVLSQDGGPAAFVNLQRDLSD